MTRIPNGPPDDATALLRAYDDQLRTDAETPGAASVTRLGPLRLVTFAGGRGFITYRDLDGADAEGIAALVDGALAHFRADPAITRVEWKSRGHDHAPGLHATLLAAGFAADERESIMVGHLEVLAVDVPLPAGVTVRRVHTEDDVRAASAAADRGFGEEVSLEMAEAILARIARPGDGLQLWAAQAETPAGPEVVCSGRLEPVAGTAFVGIWGGATLPAWRGHGIYRALTAARARAGLELGATLVHSDSTERSRPILTRAGLVTVSTTTPYRWRRP